MRPLLPLRLAAAVLLLAGCGTVDLEPPSAPPAPTGALDGFPLDLGYDAENGDDHSPVRVTHRPATQAFDLCGVPAWDPRSGTADVLGVEWRGEAEWSRGRTLALYPSADDAAAAVTAAHDALNACPAEPGEVGYGTAHTLLHQALGEQSVVWTDTYWFESEGDRLFDTGLTVHHLVRVGRAVLLAYEYGEGNGSEQTRLAALAAAAEADQPVVDAMAAVG